MRHILDRCVSGSRRLFVISTRRGPLLVVAAALFVTAMGATLAAATQGPGEETVWDGVFTQQQAERGKVAFMGARGCSLCHGFSGAFEGNSDMFPPLAGDSFMQHMTLRPVAYLYNYILENKPSDNPGSLSSSVSLALAAFILSQNGFPAGDAELTIESAARIQIVPEDWTGELPASALIRVVGCLAEGEDGDWVINSAVAPVRFDGNQIDSAAVDLTLGGGSFELLFVLARLDDLVGHRVWVQGLLVGDGGVDGVSVSRVESLSEVCQ